MPTELSSSFKYSSEPKAIKGKTKYRNENDVTLTLMSDPRVARGNTHSLARKVALASQTKAINAADTFATTARAGKIPNEPVDQLPFPTYFYEPTTFTGDGLNVLQYCEEDPATNFVTTNDEGTQSDAFVARPVTPEYVPRKTGIDCATQIEDQTELFDFDKEVLPMLNIIVDKTIEQALFEVRSEAELLALEAAADEFREKKSKELDWVRDRETQVMNEINAKRNLVHNKALEQRGLQEVRRLIAGRFCFNQLLPTIVNEVFADLLDADVWKDATVTDVVQETLPAVYDIVLNTHARRVATEELVEDLLQSAKDKYDASHYVPEKMPRIMIGFTLPKAKIPDATEDMKLGPFELGDADTILTLVGKIQAKMAGTAATQPIDAAMLQSYISSALQRSIAVDARLLNFDMPASLTVVC
jgi:hypothetical protein